MPNNFEQELVQSYKEAKELSNGIIPAWMLERANLEAQGIDFNDGMCCGITPPAIRIPK